MAKVLMYKTPVCPYCHRATALLKQKGVSEVEEVDISVEPQRRDEMLQKSGGRKTVPQIFIDDTHVGGFDDLYALEQDGKLDAMLAS